LNVRLAARSLAAYERFGRSFRADIGLDQVGYLFLLRTADDVAKFERSIAIQKSPNCRSSRTVSPNRSLTPGLAHEARDRPVAVGGDVDVLPVSGDGHRVHVVVARGGVGTRIRRRRVVADAARDVRMPVCSWLVRILDAAEGL